MNEQISSNKSRNLKEYSEKKLVLNSNPSFAWFALTSRCNMMCEHCPVVRKSEENADIIEEVYERFCKEILPTLEEVTIGANNYGEQLLSKRIVNFLERTNNEGVKVKIWTNGTLLTGEVLDKLIEVNADVTISIEGADKNYSDIRHIPYSIFKSNLNNLILERNKKKKSLSVVLRFTAFKSNLNDLFKLLDLGIDAINIGYLQPKNSEWQSKSFNFDEIKQLESQFIPSLIEKAKEKNVKIKFTNIYQGAEATKSASSCGDPWMRISVRENGDILPCCVAGDSLIMGNLAKKHFKEIWNGKRYIAFRKSFIDCKLKSTCRICSGLYSSKGYGIWDWCQKQVKSVLLRFRLYKILKFLTSVKRRIYRL